MATQPTQPIVKFSLPTQQQVLNSVERVVGVFVVAFLGYWSLSNYSFSKLAIHGAWLAGGTAVYQAVKSFLTTL